MANFAMLVSSGDINGENRKFWLSRGARFKRTRPFWFLFWGNVNKEQWKINLK
jgi:hypothetical protein